jgi:type I restriction enzyme M protein
MIDRAHRMFSDDDISNIARVYHEWRQEAGKYVDIKGFCKSVTLEEIQKHKYVLTPGRYVGVAEGAKDDTPFKEQIRILGNELSAQLSKEQKLSDEIRKQLKKVGINL